MSLVDDRLLAGLCSVAADCQWHFFPLYFNQPVALRRSRHGSFPLRVPATAVHYRTVNYKLQGPSPASAVTASVTTASFKYSPDIQPSVFDLSPARLEATFNRNSRPAPEIWWVGASRYFCRQREVQKKKRRRRRGEGVGISSFQPSRFPNRR